VTFQQGRSKNKKIKRVKLKNYFKKIKIINIYRNRLKNVKKHFLAGAGVLISPLFPSLLVAYIKIINLLKKITIIFNSFTDKTILSM
jgi:hypothetical protein